ncbi:hypothetical protein CO134_00885 [Candidatus Kuenenbacteria bacterium CG_4_9_14_3_um_filter_39_14]|uniref:Uncharacterized protein n=4 Tax=Candidatus Kueneniibacteriota TaxID=1752740 RepID=A0A2M7IL65_9BACT|nr:hypothetical protein [Candidatus Kuenenbacteria bacterium]PIP29083.1 MAG: hypothetical protein COX28_01080 [Candidatus Kuenenbacteria bacterium CG23_combo_of_CG06-09_8_20_14_all_39_39]PIR80810.1 MAG: hypothetical protein COU24_02025 [Candidatus Kuenenbacteria bacterium CG10_big_fil_rev_8_21_14_0_10_39_14]PIW95534.1 MAG: hypothetical protein COZ84_03070 [Candidatus Kuenenbacteria bacterium CG_4_8_14_3_um_filter_39_15]PJA92289.1 MAG: hypothetical protein CO134_00885 [Candidatus Kuenenbacteria 
MQIIIDKISILELRQISEKMFGNFVKVVVDIGKGIMAVDADMHVDLEKLLLENGSEQKDLWGINLYPEFFGTENFIEYDSMINIRPWQNNRSREVEDESVRRKIIEVVGKLVKSV